MAQYGRMIELGKRDFIGHGKLEMSVFEANRSFFGVDLAHVSVHKPTLCKRLLEECMDYYRAGVIKPIRPTKIFEAADVQEAFRYMQKGQHMGKIIVRLPADSGELPSETGPADLCLRSDVSYLIAGFGGIGRAISSWMVEHGAKHLILLSRSGDKSAENMKFIRILEAMGCAVEAPAGSVTDLSFVRSAIENAKRPVAGIIQTSMVLQDRAFLDMRLEDWNAAVSPKVEGTWVLHEASKSADLDFFVLMSSLSGLLGSSGQANYAAGNTFQDAFVNFRRGHGLPASVLDVGIVEDVGYVAENPHVLERYRNTHTFTIDESQLLDAIHVAIVESPVSTSEEQRNTARTAIALGSTLPLRDPANHYAWRRDVRLRTYCNIDETLITASATGGDEKNEDKPARELRQLLASVAASPKEALDAPTAYATITQGLAHRLLSFLLRSDAEADLLEDETLLSQPLSALGMDSLVAIEFRNWWRRTLGFEISVLEILDAGTLGQLGKVAIAGLNNRYGVGEATV